MEDTHAYLYNFLGTPAPVAPLDGGNHDAAHSPPSPTSSKVVETDNGYFAIFDGHAGTFAAEWCGKKLHLILEEVMRKNPNTPVPELLDQTFTSVDQQLEKLPVKNSGCTAVIALLRWEDRIPSSSSATGSAALAPAAAAAAKGDANSDAGDTPTQATGSLLPKLQEKAVRQRVLYTANVGDARIILCRNGKALRLSYDHKGSDENEGKRIANAGGLILNNRVNGVLAVTRALGDAYLKDLVTGHPYTTETVIQPDSDEFIILACDGVSLMNDPIMSVALDANKIDSYGMFVATRKPWIWFAMLPTLRKHPRFWSTTPLLGLVPIISPAWSSDSTRSGSKVWSIEPLSSSASMVTWTLSTVSARRTRSLKELERAWPMPASQMSRKPRR
jgi:serine/threonine protein phosphatase PrpC